MPLLPTVGDAFCHAFWLVVGTCCSSEVYLHDEELTLPSLLLLRLVGVRGGRGDVDVCLPGVRFRDGELNALSLSLFLCGVGVLGVRGGRVGVLPRLDLSLHGE